MLENSVSQGPLNSRSARKPALFSHPDISGDPDLTSIWAYAQRMVPKRSFFFNINLFILIGG